MLGLWKQNGELYEDTIYFARDEENLAIELGNSESKAIRVHRIATDSEELIPPVVHQLSTRMKIHISSELQYLSFDLLNWCQRASSILKYDDRTFDTLNPPPGAFQYFPLFKEFASIYLELKNSFHQKCMTPGLDSKYFVRDWWEKPVGLVPLLDKLEKTIKKFPEKGSFLEACKLTLSFLRKFVNSYNKSDVSKKHSYFSGIAYGLAIKAIERGERDMALLLTQRSLDLSAQSIALRNGLVSVRGGGLVYSEFLKSDSLPSLVKTIEYLEKQNLIHIVTSSRYDLTRINNARNNLLVTHSAYSISEQEVKSYHSSAHSINKSIVENKVAWSEGLKAITALKELSVDSFFEIHDIDSLVVTMDVNKVLEDYGL